MCRDVAPRALLALAIVAAAILPLGGGQGGSAGATRADSLAVIATSLEAYRGGRGTLFLADDVDRRVIEAGERLEDGAVEMAGGAYTFCSAGIARAGEHVGSGITLSLESGDGPLGDTIAPGSEGVTFWAPAFYMDAEVAYVAVSGSCLMRAMGGMATTELGDGRMVSVSTGGVTYELRKRFGVWEVTRRLNSWIS